MLPSLLTRYPADWELFPEAVDELMTKLLVVLNMADASELKLLMATLRMSFFWIRMSLSMFLVVYVVSTALLK
jgi:hypothetical protein